MEHFEETAVVLRAARAMLGLSQQELAEKSGVSRRVLMRIEAARPGVSMGKIQKVRSALEMQGIVFGFSTSVHGQTIALKTNHRSQPNTE